MRWTTESVIVRPVAESYSVIVFGRDLNESYGMIHVPLKFT